MFLIKKYQKNCDDFVNKVLFVYKTVIDLISDREELLWNAILMRLLKEETRMH